MYICFCVFGNCSFIFGVVVVGGVGIGVVFILVCGMWIEFGGIWVDSIRLYSSISKDKLMWLVIYLECLVCILLFYNVVVGLCVVWGRYFNSVIVLCIWIVLLIDCGF